MCCARCIEYLVFYVPDAGQRRGQPAEGRSRYPQNGLPLQVLLGPAGTISTGLCRCNYIMVRGRKPRAAHTKQALAH